MNKITNHLPTAELQALDAAHHMHPFTAGAELAAKGVRVMTQGKGVWLTDSEGHRIIDGMAGLWCVNIGYGRKELAEVAARQIEELSYYNTFFQTTHVPAIALAAKLAELAPGDLNHVFFAGSGSEANDTNIRLVRRYWDIKGQPEKTVIIARKNGYHGSTMGGGSLGGMSSIHAHGGMIGGIVHIGQPHWYAEGGDMTPDEFGLLRARELEEMILELGVDKVAAFIGEPVQGAGGVIIPPSTYWPEVKRICAKYDILLVADEVICGFGRTGRWFGSEYYGIEPDLMSIAKGLTSGYLPMGGLLVSDRVADVIIGLGDDFNHGYTYSGHPSCAAAALANLAIIEREKLVERVASDIGPYFQKQWLALGEHPLVGEARMVGLIGALELVPNKPSRTEKFAPVGKVGTLCRDISFENGLVMRATRDSMIISPPLVISHDEADELIRRAKKTLDETYVALKKDGRVK